MLTILLVITGCRNNQDATIPKEHSKDMIEEEFLDAKQEVANVLDSLFISIQNRNTDKLLSYHLYSDKFTAFSDGLPRVGSDGNIKGESQFIQNISGFEYELEDLKINVFDKVAIVTSNANFRPKIDGQIIQLWIQLTIIFVKHDGEWKITHEHLSPLNMETSN